MVSLLHSVLPSLPYLPLHSPLSLLQTDHQLSILFSGNDVCLRRVALENTMPAKRDISPLGTSKFEKPFSPPSNKSTPATSPTSPTAKSLPFSRYHINRPSVTSTVDTFSTAPTSINTTLDRAALSGEFKGLQSPIEDDLTPTLVEEDASENAHRHDSGSWSDRIKSDGSDTAYADTDALPDRATLAAVQNFPIYDAKGEMRYFGDLYEPEGNAHLRQLIIFVRYFYCPACTAYIKALTEGISTQDAYDIPIPTSIIIIGCGQPDIIPHYQQFTGCPFTMYADPTRTLFKRLGMRTTLNLGSRKPGYMSKGLLGASGDEIKILRKSLQHPEGIRKRDLFRGGNPMQIGGEFLFEAGGCVWANRMKNYRDHAEIGTLRRLVGLDE